MQSKLFIIRGRILLQAGGRRKVCQKMGGKWKKVLFEKKTNGVGNYILCSVLDLKAKKFYLVFPECQGLKKGWFLLAEKVRFLGVTLS